MASSDTDRLFLMDCTNNMREDTILEKIQRARVKMNALTASKISWHHFAAHSKVNTGEDHLSLLNHNTNNSCLNDNKISQTSNSS